VKQIKGTSNRVLEVDLENQTYDIYGVTDDERRLFLGAKGLGLKLLFDRMTPGKDPLGPDNIIALCRELWWEPVVRVPVVLKALQNLR